MTQMIDGRCKDCLALVDAHPYAPTMWCPPDCLICEDAVRLDGSPVQCGACGTGGIDEVWMDEYPPGYFKEAPDDH